MFGCLSVWVWVSCSGFRVSGLGLEFMGLSFGFRVLGLRFKADRVVLGIRAIVVMGLSHGFRI